MNEAAENDECCAYLDIETTGLAPEQADLTVIGLLIERGGKTEMFQLYNEKLRASELSGLLKGVDVLYTYNGERFDLPFINAKLKVDVARICRHRDLMHDCWRKRLYGGLKEVERKLNIARGLEGINGFEAVKLWFRYVESADEGALTTLLEYNREDVANLRVLRKKLGA